MFDSLQSRLGGVFDKLRGRGALTEADVDTALGEVRTALIEADVALGERAAAAEPVEHAAEAGLQTVEHQ